MDCRQNDSATAFLENNKLHLKFTLRQKILFRQIRFSICCVPDS